MQSTKPNNSSTLPFFEVQNKLLDEGKKREQALYDTEPDKLPALATLPYGDTAHMGKMSKDEAKVAGAEARL